MNIHNQQGHNSWNCCIDSNQMLRNYQEQQVHIILGGRSLLATVVVNLCAAIHCTTATTTTTTTASANYKHVSTCRSVFLTHPHPNPHPFDLLIFRVIACLWLAVAYICTDSDVDSLSCVPLDMDRLSWTGSERNWIIISQWRLIKSLRFCLCFCY